MADPALPPNWHAVIDLTDLHPTVEARNPHVPDVGLPVSDVRSYEILAITDVGIDDGPSQPLDGPVDLLAVDATTTSALPAVGALLRLEQAWRLQGTAIGRLLHSLCLAPGEVTQIAVNTWERSTSGQTTSDVSADEDANRSVARNRSTTEVSRLVADEVQSGGSTAFAMAGQVDAGIGGALGLLAGSGAMSSNSALATSVNWSTGARQATAQAVAQTREATAQHASNSRAERAMVVQEVQERTEQTLSSRVVANYNHMHALNMLYYEVLEVFALSTRPVHAERCIFLPMEVMAFTEDRVADFAVPLARAAMQLGNAALATAVATMADRLDHSGLVRARLQRRVEAADDARRAAINAARRSPELVRRATDQLSQATAELTELNGKARAAQQSQERLVAIAADLADARSRLNQAQTGGSIANALTAGLLEALGGNALEAEKQALSRRIAQLEAEQATLAAQAPPLALVAEVTAATRQLAAAQAAVGSATAQSGEDARAAGAAEAELLAARTELQTHDAATTSGNSAVLEALNRQRLAYNQALWMQLDPATVLTMVAGLSHEGEPLIETLDPRPLAVFGSSVAFRWAFPTTDAGVEAAGAFRQRFVDDFAAQPAEDVHVLPTGGVFAEAVLGRANAAEKLDLTRFWHWDDTTIPLLPPAIAALRVSDRARRAEVRPETLGAPTVNAAALPDAPPGPAHELANIIGASMFRDMTGAGALAGLVSAAQHAAKEGSAHAQKIAHQNISAFLDHVESMLPQLSSLLGEAAKANKTGTGGTASKTGAAGTDGKAGGLDPSKLGALLNTFGASGTDGAIDSTALMSAATEAGILL